MNACAWPILLGHKLLKKRGADTRVCRAPTHRGACLAADEKGRDESRPGRQECPRHSSTKLRTMEVHFPPELESKLSRIAAERGRNTESLVFEAVERLAGQIASHDEWFPGETASAPPTGANSSNTPTFER